MEKVITARQTAAHIAAVMGLLADAPVKLASLSQPLSPAGFRQPLAEGKRSFTEELAHLIHCEARTSEAIYLALLSDEPLLVQVHPERDWGKLLRFELLQFPDLLAYFNLRRMVLLRVLGSLSEQGWAKSVREEGKKRRESVYWKARALALHEWHHVHTIKGRLGA
jgi:hypothetical protein